MATGKEPKRDATVSPQDISEERPKLFKEDPGS